MFLKTLTFFGFLAGTVAASAAPLPPPPAVTKPSVPESGSLRVTVKLLKPQVRIGQKCPVEMDVVNISSRRQTFRTFGCSWEEQWGVSDSRLAFPTSPCRWNVLRAVMIKPGGTFRQDGDLLVNAKPGIIRFRVLFKPVGGERFSSDVLMLKVTS